VELGGRFWKQLGKDERGWEKRLGVGGGDRPKDGPETKEGNNQKWEGNLGVKK